MNPDQEIQTDAAVVAELAERSVCPAEVTAGAVDEFLVRDSNGTQHIEVIDHEHLLDRPRRRRGTVTALDADSFSLLVTDLGAQNGKTSIYADITVLKLTAILNDHDVDAGWRDDRVELSIVRTPQWTRWLSLHDKLSEQTAFALHIEENLADIVDPPAADMLELAMSFEATIDATFKSASRLKDGARQFTFNESIEARAGKDGSITVPEGFTISVSPVEGSDPVTVRAKLRFRLNSGQLKIGYSLEDPAGVERKAFDDVVAKVGESTTTPPYSAKAPASS